MNSNAIDLYIYMGNSDKIIEWLESEGIKTKSEALNRLKPHVRGLAIDTLRTTGGSLSGTARTIDKVVSHFEDKKCKCSDCKCKKDGCD